MEERKKFSASELKVGIFVVITAIVLAVAIFNLGSQVGLLQETFLAKTYLNNVSGLKPGDIVLLGGVEVGNVDHVELTTSATTDPSQLPQTEQNIRKIREIDELAAREAMTLSTLQRRRTSFEEARQKLEAAGAEPPESLVQEVEDARESMRDAEADHDEVVERLIRARANLQNIEVYLMVRSDYRDWIRRDSSISLGSVGLLGDKYVEISLGRSPDPPDTTVEKREAWWGLGEDDVEVVLITGRTQAGFQELITGANDILTNFESLSEKLQDIITRFDAGEGSVGKFFSDPTFYNNLNDTVLGAKEAVQAASQMMRDITRGEGTIPRLIQERELYDNLNASMDRLQKIAAELEEGQGTLGKLLKDPAVYDNANATMANIKGITGRMDAGQGTLGKLSTDEELYTNLRAALDQFGAFVKGIEEGQGTLGRLAKDEQLYENINEVSTEVVKLLYDFRQNPKKFLTIKLELF